MRKDMEDFPFDFIAFITPYSQQMFLAYIWGLFTPVTSIHLLGK